MKCGTTWAASGGCTSILTEDFSDGAVVEGMGVINPFGARGLADAAMRLLSPP
jgi:hypothetical protein